MRTRRWTLAATIDFGHITHYAVYLAEDQAQNRIIMLYASK